MNEEEVVKTYSDMVYKIAFNYLHNWHNADDVFSETFLKYFKKKRVFVSEEHRKAWLIRVTINCAKDFLASNRSHVELEAVESTAHYSDNFIGSELLSAINQLPAEDRNLIFLYYYEDMSVGQIAALLNMNANTVKTRLARARKKLGQFLEG